MTKIPLGWAMATMLPGACAPAPHEPPLLPVQPSADPQSEPE